MRRLIYTFKVLVLIGLGLYSTSGFIYAQTPKKSKGFLFFRINVEMKVGLPKKEKQNKPDIKKRQTKPGGGRPSTSKIAHSVKELFTNKQKHCKINAVNSGIAAGQVVQTEKYGKVVVSDFVIGKKKNSFYKFIDKEEKKRAPVTKKVSAVRNIVVKVPINEKPRKNNGEPHFKKVKLSRAESKEIIMQQLVQRKNLSLLVQMYPEERENIDALKIKYGSQKEKR